MSDPKPSFFDRFALAWAAFFRILSDPDYAGRVRGMRQPGAGTEPHAAAILQETGPEAALQLLGLLQRDGRFLDFVEEDLAAYSDAEIGAATRVVHQGCGKALREHFTIQPIRPEVEGGPVTLEAGFDASAIRLTGNVVGQAPFHGSLRHRGWRVTEVRLPKLVERHDATILAPAEVEL